MENSTHDKLELNFKTVTEVVESFLEPFFVEFLSISASCLLGMWLAMRTNSSSHVINRNSLRINESTNEYFYAYGALLDQDDRENSIDDRNVEEMRTYKRQKYFVIAISLSAAIVYFISTQLLSIGPFSRIVTDTWHIVSLKATQSIVYCPLIVMNVFSIRTLQNSNENILECKQFSTSDFLLLFTSAGYFVYLFLRIIASVGVFIVQSESNTTNVLLVVFTLISVVDIWLQTQFIITSHYMHRSVQKLPKVAQFTLIYLIAVNLAEWLYISVAHTWIENDPSLDNYAHEFVTTFGIFNTKVILIVLDPILEMYRFHSAIAAYGAL